MPLDSARREERCREVCQIQVQGLAKRLQSAGSKRVDLLGYRRTNILAYTVPGFATSRRTLEQAHRLMKVIGCEAHEIDIQPSCEQMLRDIGHAYAEGKHLFDATFENVQAGERTSHLFRFANLYQALVIGTSDLSELALGWCTC